MMKDLKKKMNKKERNLLLDYFPYLEHFTVEVRNLIKNK